MAYTTVLLTVFISGCLSFPVDDPIRIDLPVYDQPQTPDVMIQASNSQPLAFDTAYAKSIIPENYPGGERDLAPGGNLISYNLQSATNLFSNALDSKTSYINTFSEVPKIESAAHETEGLGSRALSIKENIQSIVAGLFQPKPIVDTISESEKYGNTGDKFYSAGQAVVGGASGVSSIVNSVLEVPGRIFNKITRAATEKLNSIGGKLVGL